MPTPLEIALGIGTALFPVPALATAAAAGLSGIPQAIAQGFGAHNATEAQLKAIREGRAFEREMYDLDRADRQKMYDQTRADQMPWLNAGRATLADLIAQMKGGSFETPYEQFNPSQLGSDPGYQFRMQEGEKALQRSAAARGGLNSGGTMKALTRYGQDFASNEFGDAWGRHRAEWGDRAGANMNRFNRLSTLAGLGQTSAQSLGGLGANFSGQQGQANAQHGANMGSYYGAEGNANAAGAIGNANAWSNGFTSLGNMAQIGMGMGMGGFGGGGMNIPTQSGFGYASEYGPRGRGFNLNYGY